MTEQNQPSIDELFDYVGKCTQERRKAENSVAFLSTINAILFGSEPVFTFSQPQTALVFDLYTVEGDLIRGVREYSRNAELTPEQIDTIAKLVIIAEANRERTRQLFPEITTHPLYQGR